MKTIHNTLQKLEFEYRIFVSFGIVVTICLTAGLFFRDAPSLMLLIGLAAGCSASISLNAGFILVGFIAGIASLLRVWAGSVLSSHRVMAFKVQTDALLTSGPYAIVRNPIYLADLIAICGFTLCLPPIGLIMPVLFYAHYRRLVSYEEFSLRKHFGQSYADYERRVAGFIPTLRSFRDFTKVWRHIEVTRDGIRHNALYLLFIPGFVVASITHEFWQAVVIGLPAVVDWGIIHTKIGLPKLKKNKVFGDILYAQCWEDPQIDRTAFSIGADDIVFSITSGGCNVLTFLLDNPRHVISLDLNPYQNYLLELKMAAFRGLSYDEMLEFVGVRSSERRIHLYERIRGSLSEQSRGYWNAQSDKLQRGIIHCGRYERYMRLLRNILSLIVGRKLLGQFFETDDVDARVHLYRSKWETLRWRIFTRVMLSRALMSFLFDKAFFAQLNEKFSFGTHFALKTERALTLLPIRQNYFLSYILLGRYFSEEYLPLYLRRENFETIRGRLDRVMIITDSCDRFLSHLPDGYISKFNFTNIFEWMPPESVERLLRETIRVAQHDAVVTYRNLLVPRERPGSLARWILPDPEAAKSLHAQDLSFIYDNYVVEHIRKGTFHAVPG